MAHDLFETHRKDLHDLSDTIWHNPELAFEERAAHDSITDFFVKAGIGTVTKNYLLETAFKVEYVTGKGSNKNTDKKEIPCVAFFSEYDALPGIGHACGHNLIAVVGVAAFLKLIVALDQIGILARVVLLGSPGEEGGGGKIWLKQKGALEGVDLALMSHPASRTLCLNTITQSIKRLKLIKFLDSGNIVVRVLLLGSPGEEGGGGKILMMEQGALKGIDFALMAHPGAFACCTTVITLAMKEVVATFNGENAHGTTPWRGRNALDAAVLAYSNINALRHWMHPSMRAHGIFTDGGKAPNIIPDRAELLFYFRAPNKRELQPLLDRAEECFKAGAAATGCTVQIREQSVAYDSVVQNPVLGRIYEERMEALGYKFPPKTERPFRGSTDMGDVSRVVPAIHPWFRIPCNNAPGHSVPFAEAAKSDDSFVSAMDSADGLAYTALEVLKNKELFEEMKKTFTETWNS